MGASHSQLNPPRLSAPFTSLHPYILSIPASNLPLGCPTRANDFLNAVIQDPASSEAYITKCEYYMSGDLSGHHWLVMWVEGPEDDEPVAMFVWDADHEAEGKEVGKGQPPRLYPWCEIFNALCPPRDAYYKTRHNVSSLATLEYDPGITLLQFAYLAQTAQRLFPTLPVPGLPCRWMAHVMFRAMSALQGSALPPGYVGRIRGLEEGQVELVVKETLKAVQGHVDRGEAERLQVAAAVEKRVRERVTLIGLSGRNGR